MTLEGITVGVFKHVQNTVNPQKIADLNHSSRYRLGLINFTGWVSPNVNHQIVCA